MADAFDLMSIWDHVQKKLALRSAQTKPKLAWLGNAVRPPQPLKFEQSYSSPLSTTHNHPHPHPHHPPIAIAPHNPLSPSTYQHTSASPSLCCLFSPGLIPTWTLPPIGGLAFFVTAKDPSTTSTSLPPNTCLSPHKTP
jgi:hypothetical protein